MSRPQYEYKWVARTDSYVVGVMSDGLVEITPVSAGNLAAPKDVIRELVERMHQMQNHPAIAITFNEKLDPHMVKAVEGFLSSLVQRPAATVELIHTPPTKKI